MSLTSEILAVAAGVLTVLSPRILPILPALLSASASDGFRHRPFWIVMGLAISFTTFGAVFAVFGTFMGLSNEALRDIALAIQSLLMEAKPLHGPGASPASDIRAIALFGAGDGSG